MPKKNSQNDRAESYFKVLDKDNYLYQCQYNKDTCFKVIVAKNKSALVSHLKHLHPKIYNKEINPSSVDKTNIELKRLEIIQHCTEIVSINGRPFNCFRDSGFKNLIKDKMIELEKYKCGIDLNERFTEIKEYIFHVSNGIEIKIKEDVKGRFVSLMMDCGSKNGWSVLSICVQYLIDAETRIRNLGMIRMLKRHKSSYIKEIMMNRLAVFGINELQIIGIVSDNASNMKAIIKLFENDVEAGLENVDDENSGQEKRTADEIIQSHHFNANRKNSYSIAKIQDLIRCYDVVADEVEVDGDLEAILDDQAAFSDVIKSIELDIEKTTIKILLNLKTLTVISSAIVKSKKKKIF